MSLMIIPLFKKRSVAAANLRFFFFSARDAAKLPALLEVLATRVFSLRFTDPSNKNRQESPERF